MVNTRTKGARGEYIVRDLLRDATGHQFERIPSSGALAYLKGDLWVPNKSNRFCIEVKFYAESPLTDKIFTCPKTNNLINWWNKLRTQAKHMEQEPLLFFKYNRSPVFVVTELKPEKEQDYMYISMLNNYVMQAKSWLDSEKEEFLL